MRFALGNYLKYKCTQAVYTGLGTVHSYTKQFIHEILVQNIHDYTNNNKTGDAFRTISLFKALIFGFFKELSVVHMPKAH